MTNKRLMYLVVGNFIPIAAFVFYFPKHQTLTPLYIGILPLLLCNFIYVREFITPQNTDKRTAIGSKKKLNVMPLLIMPVCFCLALPALIKFDGSLGWPPVICFGFSLLLCLVIIATYGSIKTALKKSA